MLDVLKNLILDENGQGMVEYGLVLGILATGVILLILALRNDVEKLVYEVVTKINNIISVY